MGSSLVQTLANPCQSAATPFALKRSPVCNRSKSKQPDKEPKYQPFGQICKCKWRHLVTKINTSGAPLWPIKIYLRLLHTYLPTYLPTFLPPWENTLKDHWDVWRGGWEDGTKLTIYLHVSKMGEGWRWDWVATEYSDDFHKSHLLWWQPPPAGTYYYAASRHIAHNIPHGKKYHLNVWSGTRMWLVRPERTMWVCWR